MRQKFFAIALAALAGACAHPVLHLASTIPHHQATYTPTEGDSLQRPLTDLVTRLAGWGIAVEQADGLSAFGDFTPSLRRIRLRSGLPVNAQFEVLAHEIGHIFAPRALDEATGQLFAEIVGYEIARFYGHDASLVSALYLAQMKHTFGAYRWLKTDIDFAVRAATGRETVLFPPDRPQ